MAQGGCADRAWTCPVTPRAQERFELDGYVHLPGVLAPAEVDAVEEIYERFLRGEIEVPGRDASGVPGRAGDDAAADLARVQLPRQYHPAWRDNVFERRAGEIACALLGPDMVLDYDELLARPPRRPRAVVPWHQDLAYWIRTPDTRTACVMLALDDADRENGCVRYVRGSHLESELRLHEPVPSPDGSDVRAIRCRVDEGREEVRCVAVRRGDVLVHGERVIHGSGENRSDRWRRSYVLVFRTAATVRQERRYGVTHSRNDPGTLLELLRPED